MGRGVALLERAAAWVSQLPGGCALLPVDAIGAAMHRICIPGSTALVRHVSMRAGDGWQR
jgi:hypothetical protein